MPSGNKPLPEPMLTQIHVAIWCHKATIFKLILWIDIYGISCEIVWVELYGDLDLGQHWLR